jgi:hypothetical protein
LRFIRASAWLAAASVDPAFGTVDCHGPLAGLVGGARGGQPDSNVSMTTMEPPQQGQGCARLGVSSASVLGSVWSGGAIIFDDLMLINNVKTVSG